LYMGSSRLNNVSFGLVAIFIYYALVLSSERVARSGLAPPELVLPLPPLIFMAASAYFIRCEIMERIPAVVRLLQRLIMKVRRRYP